MTDTTRTLFEKHEIRKSKKQKTAFIDYVSSIAGEKGYRCSVEKGNFGVRNIVVGDPEGAKVIYTAHYDTCARFPFPNFITPKNFVLYLLYQFAAVILFCFVPIIAVTLVFDLAATLMGVDSDTVASVSQLIYYLLLLVFIWLVAAGPANKHTANDNTSGVTVLLDMICSVPTEQRDKVAFVFFDLEEMGLFGSSAFASKHKAVKRNKLLINFDCVSDGDNILFVLNKKAKRHLPVLSEAYKDNGDVRVEIATAGVFYPSDQVKFNQGVGVAALKHSKLFGLYMDRIHTNRDTVYRYENIKYLVDSSVKLIEIL